MRLYELSAVYRADAQALRLRITELRAAEKAADDPEAARRLARRIADLEPMLRQARDLAVVTARYYERGYHKNEKYCL